MTVAELIAVLKHYESDMQVNIRVCSIAPEDLGVTDEELMIEDGEVLAITGETSVLVEHGEVHIIGDKQWD